MTKKEFFEAMERQGLALTFDDVSLKTGYSEVPPAKISVVSLFSTNIVLKSPFVSAAMSAVTGHVVSEHMALFGGIGVIHYSYEPDEQAAEVALVKSYFNTSGLDIDAIISRYPRERWNLDPSGRLRVAAAISTIEADSQTVQRAEILVKEGVDALVIDTAHGVTKSVFATLAELKHRFGNSVDVVVGNVSNGPSAKRLADEGVNCIKVGQGCGATCKTRDVTGCGTPQLSAIYDCVKCTIGLGIPICADGGITKPGDVTKAIAAGADSVMLGRALAGTDEAPNGDIITLDDGTKWKSYWGMGSRKALAASALARGRYNQQNADRMVTQGVEGLVEYVGRIDAVLYKYEGGLRYGMGMVGAADIEQLKSKAEFVRVTSSGLQESRPHHMMTIKGTSNCKGGN